MEEISQPDFPTEVGVLRAQMPNAETLLDIGRKHLFDETHALHVAALSLSLFNQLSEVHGMNGEDLPLLLSAAVLHDIGTCYGIEKHHKTSLELIRKVVLPDLDPKQQLIIANIARYHRKKPPNRKHKAYTLLPKSDQERVVALSSILRIADALDASHGSRIRHVHVYCSKTALRLSLETTLDCKEELEALRKKALLFEATFGRSIRPQKN